MLKIEAIKQFAKINDISAVGAFSATDFIDYLSTINERAEYSQIDYKPLESFKKAGYIPQEIKTVIVLVVDYYVESSKHRNCYRFANYVRNWQLVNNKTSLLKEFLKKHGLTPLVLDLPQRSAACRANLGYIGKNCMFYAYGLGSYVGISSIGINISIEDLDTGSERNSTPQCENCEKCIKACPVKAIHPHGFRIDPLKCLSMLNRHPDESKRIPPQKKDDLAGWLHGCETCQNVCPINANINHSANTIPTTEIKFANMNFPNASTISTHNLLSEVANCSSAGYREYIYKLTQ